MEGFNRWVISIKGTKEFNGTPKRYRKYALWFTVLFSLWIYFAFVSIKYVFQGENWFGVWEFPAILIGGALFFYRYFYTSMMRLDGQYGRGSGWSLEKANVKLPVLKERQKAK